MERLGRQPRTVRRTRIESVAEPQARFQPKLFRNDGTPPRSDQIRRTRLRADAILASCEELRPLDGKQVVLIHTLLGLDREDSVSFLAKLGAVVQSKINLQTHYVIIGSDSTTETNEKGTPLANEQVTRRIQDGQPTAA